MTPKSKTHALGTQRILGAKASSIVKTQGSAPDFSSKLETYLDTLPEYFQAVVYLDDARSDPTFRAVGDATFNENTPINSCSTTKIYTAQLVHKALAANPNLDVNSFCADAGITVEDILQARLKLAVPENLRIFGLPSLCSGEEITPEIKAGVVRALRETCIGDLLVHAHPFIEDPPLLRETPEAKSGLGYEYSNLGYVILGDWAAKNLGCDSMEECAMDWKQTAALPEPEYYTPLPNQQNFSDNFVTPPQGNGCFVSSAADLVRLVREIENDPPLLEAMCVGGEAKSDGSRYAQGFEVLNREDNVRVLYRHGNSSGASSGLHCIDKGDGTPPSSTGGSIECRQSARVSCV